MKDIVEDILLEEVCGNCHRTIGALEDAYVWGQTVVCFECRQRLATAGQQFLEPVQATKVDKGKSKIDPMSLLWLIIAIIGYFLIFHSC